MGFRHNGHRRRNDHKGEDYVKLYRLEKWINQCIGCQARGYKPDMPDEVAHSEFAARYVRGKFRPLALNENGLCEVCKGKSKEPPAIALELNETMETPNE